MAYQRLEELQLVPPFESYIAYRDTVSRKLEIKEEEQRKKWIKLLYLHSEELSQLLTIPLLGSFTSSSPSLSSISFKKIEERNWDTGIQNGKEEKIVNDKSINLRKIILNWKQGKKEGEQATFNIEGRKIHSLWWKGGKQDGEEQEFNHEGTKIYSSWWKEDKEDGELQRFNNEGRKISSRWWKEGKLGRTGI